MKMQTRSKSRKPVIPDSIMCSDTEDDEPRPRQRKRNHTSAISLRAGGTSKYFRRNSNQFLTIESPARILQLVKLEPAVVDESDQVQGCASAKADSNLSYLTTTLNFPFSSHFYFSCLSVDATVYKTSKLLRGYGWRPRLSSCMPTTGHYGHTCSQALHVPRGMCVDVQA